MAEVGWGCSSWGVVGDCVTIVCVSVCTVLEVAGGGCGFMDGSGVKVVSGFIVVTITVVGANSSVESGSGVCCDSAAGSVSMVKTDTSLISLR